MGSTNTTGALVFTGISSYSSDFQTVLQRDVSIAQLPLTALQNTQTTNDNVKQALVALNPDVANLGSAVAALGTIASSQGMGASSSDSTTVSVVNTGATSPATYTISNIQSLATSASATSTQFTNATKQTVAASGTVDLVVGSNTYQLNLSSANNNLTGLAAAINSATSPTTGVSAGVTATILTTSSGDYLSISANNPGASSIQLNAMPSNSSGQPVSLIANSVPGTAAVFTLNGITPPVTESTNTISDIIPGVSFTLNKTTTGSVTLSLAPDPSQLSSALQSFVNDYNTVATDLSAQEGTSGGPLDGDQVIRDISSDMQQLATYWNTNSSSSIRSLSDLGITFNDSGQLSFDQATFDGLSDTQVSDAFKFFGSSNSGFAALANNFSQISDPVTGEIETEEAGCTQEDTQLTSQISTLNTQIAAYQASVTSQLQAADATCANLESEQNNVTAEVQSVDYVMYGRQTNLDGM
jgi:flagellar hook-associated protein 2